MEEVILYLLQVKNQHRMRLEDACTSSEIEESFGMVKARLTEELLYKGYKDFNLLAKNTKLLKLVQ